MNQAGSEQPPTSRWVNLVLAGASMAAAIVFQALLSFLLLPTVPQTDSGRITDPGHIDAVYQGSVLANRLDTVANVSLDPNFNAAAPTRSASDGAGRIAGHLYRAFDNTLTADQYRWYVQSLPVLVPFLIAFAVRAAGGSLIAVAIAPWIAIAAWALRANQLLFVAGHCELILAGPVVTVYLSSLYGFHRQASLLNWFGLAGASLLGWIIVPVPWTVVSVFGAICWLLVAHRHSVSWNGLAMLSFIIGVSPLLPPLIETLTRPDILAQINPVDLTSWLTPYSQSNASIEWMTAFPVIAALGFGIVRRCIFCAQRSSAAEWILGCTLAGLAAGFILHQNAFITTASFDAIALWSAFLMAAPLSIWLAPQRTWLGSLNVIIIASGIAFAALHVPSIDTADQPAWGLQHLTLGWSAEDAAQRNQCHAVLRPTARVLWERQPGDRFSPAMIPLDLGIPVLTGRDLQSDDQPWSFVQGVLGSRSITDWSDDDLSRYCERWNIGWIRTVSRMSQARLARWSKAKQWDSVAPGLMVMFSIERPQSYFLRGSGTVESAAPNQIVLSDVKPEGGDVVLSFTWHPGWTSAPSHVVIEPETSAFESVPLIRLKLQGPISRVVLRWTGR